VNDETLQQLTNAVVALLQPTVLAVATYLGVKFASWFKRKTNIDAQGQVERILDLAIDYAEERARDWVKASSTKMPGGKKMDIALAFAVRELQKRGLAKKAGSEIGEWIEALLHARRPTAFVDDEGNRIESVTLRALRS
jgi:hypothetical protein